MEIEKGLLEGVQERVEGLGYELVDLRRKGSSTRAKLDLRIDVTGPGAAVTVDDCSTVSRALESWLDESGILGINYVLEVSSPGIERPIRWVRHWQRFVGSDVNVKLRGRGRVKATIVAVEGEEVVLRPITGSGDEPEELKVAISDELNARLAVDWNEV